MTSLIENLVMYSELIGTDNVYSALRLSFDKYNDKHFATFTRTAEGISTSNSTMTIESVFESPLTTVRIQVLKASKDREPQKPSIIAKDAAGEFYPSSTMTYDTSIGLYAGGVWNIAVNTQEPKVTIIFEDTVTLLSVEVGEA